ncbi:MAG: hypothetical protein AAGI68_07505 [Planctomycetota bacterium]
MPRPLIVLTLCLTLAVVLVMPALNTSAQNAAPATLSDRAYAQEVLRARQQLLAKDNAGGILTLSRAIDARPDLPDGPLLRARLFLGINRPEPALKDIELVLSQRPHFPPAVQLKAALVSRSGKPADALRLVDAALLAHRDNAMLLAVKADLFVELDDYDNLVNTLDRLVAVAQDDKSRQAARLHAAKAYARAKAFSRADAAVTRVIQNDKNPSHRLLRITIREQWEDVYGAVDDIEFLLKDQKLMEQHAQIKSNLQARRRTLRDAAAEQRGPVFIAAVGLMFNPDSGAKRDALAEAVIAMWQDADHPLHEQLIGRRTIHSRFDEPTLAELNKPKGEDVEDFTRRMMDANSRGLADRRRLDRDRPQVLQAKYELAQARGEAMRAEETRHTTPEQKLDRDRELVEIYPFSQSYEDFGLAHLAAGEYDQAKRAFAIAAGLRAYDEFERPSLSHNNGLGRKGGPIGSCRRLYQTAQRLAVGRPNAIESQLAKAFEAVQHRDFLAAGLAHEAAKRLDQVGREGSIYTDNEWLSTLYFRFRGRYLDDILTAYVEAALEAKQRGDTKELERYTELIDKGGSFAHPLSRTFMAMLDLEKGDTEAAEKNLGHAFAADPLFEWAHLLQGRIVEKQSDLRLALLHYSAGANQGQPTGMLQGFEREAGFARDRLENQFKDTEPFQIYAEPLNAIIKEKGYKGNAGLIYATARKLLQFDPHNNGVRRAMIRAAYLNKDAFRLKFLVEHFATTPEVEATPSQIEWAYRLLGLVYASKDKDDRRAIAAYDKSLAAADNDDTYSYRGHAHFRLKQYDQALADIDKAIELGNDSWSAYSVRAQIHEIRRDYESAYQDIKKAAALKELQQGKVGIGVNNLVLRISQKRLDTMFGRPVKD